ncbi:MAG: hypothetical protein A2070_10710 [Bdellovibrionales bacterium GWC1_52_8]|nr:MAG: hypothetical protein A2070_10710 [Bdellovibrionales bacterium GWC1_52_8]
MYSFGPKPPRALLSFGVSGLLEESCRVYYDNMFSTRHVGKVSDLLAAKLKSAGLDELRLRAILLFGIFEGYYNPGIAEASSGQVMVECGVDAEKIAVGLSFVNPHLAKRLASKINPGIFDSLLATLHAQSDRLLVRVLVESGKIEIVAMLAIPGKISMEVIQEKGAPEVLLLDRETTVATPAAEFTQLGDLDFPALLREENPVSKLEPSPSGTIVSSEKPEVEPEIRFAGERSPEEQKRKVSGTTQQIEEENILVGGTDQALNQEALTVQGGAPAGAEESILISGSGEPVSGAAYNNLITELSEKFRISPEIVTKIQTHFRAQSGEYQLKIAELETQLKTSKFAERAPVTPPAAESKSTAAPITEAKAAPAQETGLASLVPGFIKRAFSKAVVPSVPEAELLMEPGELVEDSGKTVSPPVQPEIEALPEDKPVEELTTETLEKALTKAASESQEIKKEIGSERAKHWVDGMMGEILSEKALLVDKAKHVNTAIRQKELEFRNRQATLLEEIKRRDESIRQKDNLIIRLKEQLAEMTMIVERIRNGSSSIDSIRHKQKVEMTQKMLKTSKAENLALVAKIEDLRAQLANVSQASKASNLTSAELSTMRIRFDHVNRQCEEFKKANHLLSEKLALVKREKAAVGGGTEELKRRMELAMQTANAHQKDAEEYRLKSEELKREEVRLKMELGRAQTEIKTLKASVLKIQKAVVNGGTGTAGGGAKAA